MTTHSRLSKRYGRRAAMFIAGCCWTLAGASALWSQRAPTVGVALDSVAVLRDSARRVLVRPYDLFRDARGATYVVDISDRDVKRFDATGMRAGTFGHTSGSDGFRAVKTIGSLRGSLVAFDMAQERLCHLEGGASGRVSCSTPVTLAGSRPIRASVVDDSLLLITHTCLEGAREPLLTITDASGKRIVRMFQPKDYLGESVKLWTLTDAVADAHDGVVFAGLIGSDSVWAFDYQGRQIGRGTINILAPAATTKALLAANHGDPQLPDHRWIIDGQWRATRIVALDRKHALVQLSKMDGVRGIDLLDGGRVAVVEIQPNGTITTVASTTTTGGLLGRDAQGGLLMRRGRAAGADFELWRLTLSTRQH